MFNFYHKPGHLILGFALIGSMHAALSAAEDKASFAIHSDEYITLYELKESDTPEGVAERLLGDSVFANELLRFNQLTHEDFKNRKLPIIAIPGKTRTEAREVLEAVEQARTTARTARAPEYAARTFEAAVALHTQAENSRQAANYDKARHVAAQALNKFVEATAMANEKAPVQQQGKVVAVHGTVQISPDGGLTWEVLDRNSRIKKGEMIQTGPLSRVKLQFEDASQLRLLGNSRLEIKNLRFDPRVNDRHYSIDLWSGILHAKLAPLESARASFKINLADVSITANGAHMKLGCADKRKGWMALFKGQALVTTKEQEIFLPLRKGITFSRGKLIGDPVNLLEPPLVTDPAVPEHRTAVQHPVFAWRETGTRKPGAYRLEIARDAGMMQMVTNRVIKADTFKAELLEEGTYFWQVSTIDPNGIEGLDAEPAKLEIKKNLDILIKQKQPPIKVGERQVVSHEYLFFAQPAQADTSVVAFEYQINQQEPQPLPRLFRLEGEGQMAVRVWGISADGERGPQQEIHVFVDRTPPLVTCLVDSRPNPLRQDYEQAVVMLKARDASGLSLLEYSINNKSFKPYIDPLELDVKKELMIRYRATDGVGNLSSIKAIRIYPSDEKQKINQPQLPPGTRGATRAFRQRH